MTIKLKILMFALVAVLVPFSVLGYVAYAYSVHLNRERFEQELLSLAYWVSAEAGRRAGELRGDVQTFAGATLLQEALADDESTSLRVDAYFESLRSRFPDYLGFVLTDADGVPAGAPESVGGHQDTGGRNPVKLVIGKAGEPLLQLAVPVVDASGATAGYLVADISLRVLRPLLRGTQDKRLYLVSERYRLLEGAGNRTPRSPVATAPRTPVPNLESAMLYRDHRGVDVLGVVVPTGIRGMRVLAEMKADEALGELNRLKIRVFWMLLAMLLPLMLLAYLFGVSLVRPLDVLTERARRVAKGDLDVDLPSARRDEIGYLSRVFNEMVERLRDSRHAVVEAQARLVAQNRRLEELTVTDNLTGLANRRSLTQNLLRQLDRYRRNGRPFCVLMLDLDHFKSVNDRYGHLAGDEVLRHFAAHLAGSVRAVDFAARYGGEEFTVILFETGRSAAWESAERIRERVAEMVVPVEPGVNVSVTLSIGIAEACAADGQPDDLLQRADVALYEAKQAGRNRICFAASPKTDTTDSLGHG
jgi:diguanylate cyclase (GGDEF)-like protein